MTSSSEQDVSGPSSSPDSGWRKVREAETKLDEELHVVTPRFSPEYTNSASAQFPTTSKITNPQRTDIFWIAETLLLK